ncbi:hypothetical protein PR048_009317 [Dryococelus australis]|uniref:Uncharacterized protein n=1 Tax=Dryococelus australis TaxID=614101 RepID=A0ABQ9HZI7_9NEOP|nr:hypothetical protein PR048_009317 [Dryococelus australis]
MEQRLNSRAGETGDSLVNPPTSGIVQNDFQIRKSWCRNSEGVYNILIKRHLLHDDEKFRAFFRLNIQNFDFVLELVKEELTTEPCNRIP